MLEFAATGEKAAADAGAGRDADGQRGRGACGAGSGRDGRFGEGDEAGAGQPGPAALDPDGHGIEVLEEGGLLEGKVYTGRRISLDFKDVEIDDVLRLIAEVSELNIIAGDEVQGSGHDPPGGRALGPGARRHPADQGPRLRAGGQRAPHRARPRC